MKRKVFVTVVEVSQPVEKASPQAIVDTLKDAGYDATLVKAGGRMVEG